MILNELSKRNKEWHRIALSICKDEHLANDLVQLMYFRILKYIKDVDKIKVNGKINSLYIYVTIKNIYYQHKNKLKKKKRFEYKEYDCFDESNDENNYSSSFVSTIEDEYNIIEYEQAHQKIINKIEKEIKTWHWYDEKLFRLYYYTDKSLRKIAKETSISLTSIYNSCKNYKEIIKDKYGEDIADLFNKDYDKIK
jgi:DNA-directed RNA polymerase specialized sigma24 family protein|tara:strand:- start:2414 stop:3001 length:588 start_codon:yes stop_codon:yes gene_type:complete